METVVRLAASPFASSAFVTRVNEGVIVPLIQFGGQAAAYWQELALAYRESAGCRALIERVTVELKTDADSIEALSSGMLPQGFEVVRWLHDESVLPNPVYLQSSSVSQSLIFLTQMCHVIRLQESLRSVSIIFERAVGFIGHSQGIMAAVCCAYGRTGDALDALVTDIARFFFWQGIRMQQAFLPTSVTAEAGALSRDRGEGDPSPMAALAGLTGPEVMALLAQVNSGLPATQRIYRTLTNHWDRTVVSGHPVSLGVLRTVLLQQEDRWQRDPITRHKKVSWHYLPTSAPFHSPYMESMRASFRDDLRRCGITFAARDLRYPVYSTANGNNLQQSKDLLSALVQMQWIQALDWPAVLRGALHGSRVTHIVDFGPTDSVARLSARVQRGTGVAVIAAATDAGRESLLKDAAEVIPVEADWTCYRPRLATVVGKVPRVWLDNAFTRFAKVPPIFGGGLTPTSVETDIIVAAANAGYLLEWAGGGQVTEPIWAERRAELQRALAPGRGVVFNALFLDPYLWRLHYPAIIEQKRQGFPYIGVTISAGIPEVEQAAHILRELNAAGMWCNAFKPGSDAQIEHVLTIADAVPEISFLMQIEGGKAGGHHSWEDVHGLLLRNYAAIRQRQNIIVCVGGGVAHPEQAVTWLWGDWHGLSDLPPMPVDGVFLGTRLMACKEAKTSSQVKALLVRLPGTEEWVRPGECKGGVTSQKSQLNADVHFADTAAARAGALLDQLAGRPIEEVHARKDEIVRLLNKTAKPYFGDVATMTYTEVFARMVELMAPGVIPDYLPHDGVWFDVSFRDRAFTWVQRVEARCGDHAAATPSRVHSHAQLDRPVEFARALAQWFPRASSLRVHPEDVEYFLFLCRLPGKPVNFVPVIDTEVRRWYKADSLWQSHDPRYPADAVFTIPGPAAVTGITKVDEPIVDIFRAFEQAVIKRLRGTTASAPLSYVGETPREVGDTLPSADISAAAHPRGTRYVLQARPEQKPDGCMWLDWIAGRGQGPLHAFLRAEYYWVDGRLRPNLARQLLIPDASDEWTVEVRVGELAMLKTSWCDLTVNGAHVVWRIFHHNPRRRDPLVLSLTFTWHPDHGVAPIHAASSHAEVLGLYRALFVASRKNVPHVAIGARFQDTITVTAEAIRAYANATGMAFALAEDGRAIAPPMMTIAHAWQPMAEVLLACGAMGDLLQLLHSGHGVRLAPGMRIVEGDRVQSQLTITETVQAPTGLRVRVHGEVRCGATVVAWLETEFFLRGYRGTRRGDSLRDATAGIILPRSSRETPSSLALSLTSTSAVPIVQPYTAFTTEIRTPATGHAYAMASGDCNPIHLDAHVAGLAQLSAPIVHGMWSAAAVVREAVQQVVMGDAQRLAAATVQFTSPVLFHEACTVSGQHVAMVHGGPVLDCQLTTARGPAVVGRLTLRAPRTAYLFTGQGAQVHGMGMDAYARSTAARAVWDRADRFCRDRHGFSILHIVRDNPKQLRMADAAGTIATLRHPQGVLHLTQFTQVALTVVAMASVAELHEAGCYVPDALFAGHSLGEYAALAAAEIMPFEDVLTTVYQRGLTMQHFVPRDRDGTSPYRMAVVRPNLAGLDEATLTAFIATLCRDTDGSLEIVNYNIEGEQYAVTGHTAMLEQLERKLSEHGGAMHAPGINKPVMLWLDGIDVPFHSTVLRDGVADFRKTLERAMPARIDPTKLVDRYIPNLTAQLFSVSCEYVEAVRKLTHSPVLRALLTASHKGPVWRDEAVARTVLIELLAYQFASPVQWIATQRLVLSDRAVAAHHIVEIGPQPVLANMARRSLKRWGVVPGPKVHHVEHERREVFYLRDRGVDAAPVSPAGPVPEASSVMVHGLPDCPLPIEESLRYLLALKLRLRPDEICPDDTIEKLTHGNSARRNEILADLGAEFNVGAIDEAHHKAFHELVTLLTQQAAYNNPGPYFRVAADQAIKERLCLTRHDIVTYLQTTWVVGPGRTMVLLNLLPVAVRTGNSTGSGLLSPIGVEGRLTTTAAVQAWLDTLVAWYGTLTQVTVPKRNAPTAGATAPIDSAALQDFEAKYFGQDGVFGRLADVLLRSAGADPYAAVVTADQAVLDDARALQLYRRAFGPAVERAIVPQFSPNAVVIFSSTWNWARCRVVELYWLLVRGDDLARDALAARIDAIVRGADAETIRTLMFYREKAQRERRAPLAKRLGGILVQCTRALRHPPRYRPKHVATLATVPAVVRTAWQALTTQGISLAGQTILVTGAGPDSIGVEVVRLCLKAGARVVVGSTRVDRTRVQWWRDRFREEAARGAELILVPMNQGAQEDCQRAIEWMYQHYGALDVVFPFAAVRGTGDLTTMDAAAATVTWRVLLQSVEWVIAAVAQQNAQHVRPPHATTVVLPGSPNHGVIGGDGAYGAAKAALEVLTNRWRAEHDVWGQQVALIGARIGWTRGTGLMKANDAIADLLEQRTTCRTFSSAEMALLLVGAVQPAVRAAAAKAPLWLDMTGGFDAITDLAATFRALRTEVESSRNVPADVPVPPPVPYKVDPQYFAFPSVPSEPVLRTLKKPNAALHDVYVIVGFGEVSPYGSARTRWAVECGQLSPGACLELAWLTGRIRFERTAQYVGWVDAHSGAPIADHECQARYERELLDHAGIRIVDPQLQGYDPHALTIYANVQLDQELCIPVESLVAGEAIVRQYPGQAHMVQRAGAHDAPQYVVRLSKGAVIKVPHAGRLSRTVAGQIPEGWDPARYGLSQELIAQVDRNTLFNFVATVDAFLSAGIEPRELQQHIRPTRIANTQGGGMGGQMALERLFHDYREGRGRKGDTLQETLINVMAGWITQSYVGGYGASVHPVGACATAVVSLDTAVNLLASGKADFVVAGGYDDISAEGALGFSDMEATADIDAMGARGIDARTASRPNDRRRGGFVEAQGGGTFLVTRGSHAVALGLPIYAVVGYVGIHSDGIHTSIPAPGLGLLGMKAPLQAALTQFGLTADDIAAVSKHDTSTHANDLNENHLHHLLQMALGRSAGNPLLVHSQKALLGHAKGGAGAWQIAAAVQMLHSGIVPGNPHLEDVDPAMQPFSSLSFPSNPVQLDGRAVRAVLLTSLGFGHVGAGALLIHPDCVLRLLSSRERSAYAKRRAARETARIAREWRIRLGLEPAFEQRREKPLTGDDEVRMLLGGE